MKDLKKNFSRFFNKFWPVGLLVIVVFAFFWKVFFKGQIPFPGDFVLGVYFPWLDYKWGFIAGVPVKNPIMADVPSFIWPMLTLGIKMLKEGQLPLWNPYILNGNPLLANFQSAPFSPTNIFYFLTDTADAWSLQIISQHILAALFTYLLLRHWKISKLGSVFGGIVYAFSGFNLIWSQWDGHALSAAFIPLILLLEDKFLSSRKVWFGVLISLSLAIQIVSGYPQVVLYTALAMLVLYLIRVIPRVKESFKECLMTTGLFILFSALGLGLAAPQLLPGSELLKTSQRIVEYHPFEWAFLPWGKAITFIASDFYGNHATKNYWGPQDYTSNTGMVGVVALTLGILAVGLIKKSREVLYLVILTLVALILAFPTPVAIFLWHSGFLGLNAASAHRSLVIFDLGIAALAAFGLDSLLLKSKFKNKLIALMVPALMLLGFGVYAYLVRAKTTYGVSVFPIAVRNLILPTVVLVVSAFALKLRLRLLLIVLAVVELFYFGWKFTPFFNKNLIFPKTPVLDFLTNQAKPFRVTGNRVIPMNMRMPYGLESPEGYDAVYPAETSKLIFALNDAVSSQGNSGRYGFIDREDSKILDLMNTKYFLALKLDARGNPDKDGKNLLPVYNNPKFKKVFEDKTVVVLENKNVLPRAFLVYDWDVISSDSGEIGKLLDTAYPLAQRIVLSENPSGIAPIASGSSGKVSYQNYKENSSVLTVETERSGMLFVSDTYYPGWKAYVDDKETKIYRADYAFRAIVVPAGSHVVKFIYHPDSFFNGLKIAGVSALVIAGMIGYTLVRKRKNAKN